MKPTEQLEQWVSEDPHNRGLKFRSRWRNNRVWVWVEELGSIHEQAVSKQAAAQKAIESMVSKGWA